MASKVQLALDYSRMTVGSYEGVTLPQFYEPVAEHLVKLKEMEICDDDILLCCYPKSGTHRLFRIIDMLQRGQAVYDKRTVESTYIDGQRIEEMAGLDSPRLLISHLAYYRLPQQVLNKSTKIVHVYRNPRSLMVSYPRQTVAVTPKEKQHEMQLEKTEILS